MSTIQAMAARARRECDTNGLPCSAEGGTYHTRSDDEQAQFERNEAARWQFSIIKCYGSMDNYYKILRSQHGVHDRPIKPRGLA
jgi:hypothetical protein